MSKMIGLGFKDTFFPETVSSSKEKTKIRFPNLRIRDKVPDFLMDKDIGKTVKLVIEAKITEKGIEDGRNGKEEHLELDVLKVGLDMKQDNSLQKRLSQRK